MPLGRVLSGKPDAAPSPASRIRTDYQPDPGGPGSLCQDLNSWLTQVEDKRLGGEYVHASSLYDLCTKQHVLIKEGADPTPKEVIPSALRFRFDQGSAIHDLIRERYLGPMGRLYGGWRCRRCSSLATGLMPARCQCGSCDFKYCEPEYKDERLKIVGHVDGIDKDPMLGFGVLEIKTIDGNLFRILKAPQPEHAFRSHVYMYLAGYPWCRILYASMAMEKKVPFREFIVRYDKGVMDRVERRLLGVRNGGERVCTKASDPRAVGCPVSNRCFP